MDQSLTKADLQHAVTAVGRHFTTALDEHARHMDERFDQVNHRLDAIGDDVRLLKRAVLDLASDAHLHNLVRELRAKGIELDDNKIFVA